MGLGKSPCKGLWHDLKVLFSGIGHFDRGIVVVYTRLTAYAQLLGDL